MAPLPSLHRSFPAIRAQQPPDHLEQGKVKKATNNPRVSLPNLLGLRTDATRKTTMAVDWEKLREERYNAPAALSKEAIRHRWREIHGSQDSWRSLLNPLDPFLRNEMIKYGEFCQATYDAFDFDKLSEFCGSCRYNRGKLFAELGLETHGYEVMKYVYAMSQVDVPQWLERSNFLDVWSRNSNWMGYVAVSNDEESRRIGRRDIAVAWRGTVAPSEWYKNFQSNMEPIKPETCSKVELGFHRIYTSKNEATRYNKVSASEQVMEEIKWQAKQSRARGEDVSLTITGHSLGGALALLNAYDVASAIPDLPTSVISFGAPRVGNNAFREDLRKMGVTILRVVIEQDLVPKSLGFFLNEGFSAGDWVYAHAGTELKLDIESSPFLKRGTNLAGFHGLEVYLHLLDGYHGGGVGFRQDAGRDIALVNKASDMLVEELRIPKKWFQLANKGLVKNCHGRWVLPKREPEDIPSPHADS